mmetsp:Transcript_7605/g.18599  ORF Transcript_7605/g.18599 Transcript_7605/m.18599 type:complete len:89 (-) Transcript_7605:197-463(-)
MTCCKASEHGHRTFPSSLTPTHVIVKQAINTAVGAQLVVGGHGMDRLWLWESAVEGLCLVRVGWAFWEGRLESLFADEMEVLHLQTEA